MTINISIPKTTIDAQLKPRITVVGVGGAGGNAVNNMIQSAMEGVDFVVANTDAQALASSRTDRRIQLGRDTTQGLGAGARPDIGRHAAEEALEVISRELEGAHMAFITAGMGGGTGTGAAPVIARMARELGVLTVGVVTKPFHFEGVHRMRLAEAGIEELAAFVDTLIVIPNQNLFRVANEKTTFADAFKMADDVLHGGVRSVTDLMTMPGMINLDFADVRTVMKEMGRAMMGTGEAEGDRRALDAAEAAIANPLLEETSMRGAKGVLINITGGNDITLFEVDEAANRIRDEVESDAHIIFGSCFDESMSGKIRVSVVATGIESEAGVQPRPMTTRQEPVRAVGRRLPEIRTAAPTVRSPVTAQAAPVQPSFGGFGFGGTTLAPATGTMDLQAEEKALMEMAAAVRAEIDQVPAASPAPEAEVAAAPAPAPVMAAPAMAAPAPQMAALAEAVARAPAAAPARTAPAVSPFAGLTARETFIPKPPMEPRMDVREPRMEPELRYETAAPAPVMGGPAPAPAAAKTEPTRVRLFDRYRSLTARKVEDAPVAPQPQAKLEQRPSGMSISVGPSDRPVSSHSEDELEIPAFLRRQAN
ncbi:MAG: cell division protein FtsZ [Rhodospirillaceae bacterium]|nr:cell division protein FtsZ [Rhodospirillaceae bacterium]